MRVHHTSLSPKNWPCKWFSPAEIACRGTGMLLIDPDSTQALKKLDRLREILGAPMILNSAYRSPSHNKAVGGAKNSLHMRGIAFDVRMDNHDPAAFESAARAAGFTGFGYYPKQGFMHIDTGPARTWGTPFKPRDTRFAPEPPRQNAARDVVETVPVAMSGGAAVEVALRELAPNLAPDWQGYALGAAALIGLGLALWRIIARARQPNGVAE